MTEFDPYAGASQSASEVAGRAVGAPAGAPGGNQQPAESSGYYTDDDGVRRKVIAGDPVPADLTIEADASVGPSADDQADSKAKRKPAEDKAAKQPAESK